MIGIGTEGEQGPYKARCGVIHLVGSSTPPNESNNRAPPRTNEKERAASDDELLSRAL